MTVDEATQRMDTDIAPPISNDYMINMYDSLKVMSYNCRGFPKTPNKLGVKPTINSLLNEVNGDIICLQETFLSKQDLSCLNVIHKDFQSVGASSTDTNINLFQVIRMEV